MIFFKNFLFLVSLSFFTIISVFSQTNNLPKITESTIVFDIIKKKKENPKMNNQVLADFANQLLAKKGFNYNFEMSELFFQNTPRKEFPETQKEQIIKFPFEFSLANNSKKTFEITAKHNLQNQCYDESQPAFPVTQVTDAQATVIFDGKPGKVKIPKEFDGQTLFLIDAKTRKRVLQKWVFPYSYGISEESFVGFSADGKKLYVTVEDGYIYDYDNRKEVKELALEISSDGNLRFVPKAGVKKKFKMDFAARDLQNLPVDMVLKITTGGKVYYLAAPNMSC